MVTEQQVHQAAFWDETICTACGDTGGEPGFPCFECDEAIVLRAKLIEQVLKNVEREGDDDGV